MTRGILMGQRYIKYEHEKDKLRMAGGAWSINLDRLPPEATSIRYITNSCVYEISLEDAVTSGFERIFGGEKKLVVPINKWTKKVR